MKKNINPSVAVILAVATVIVAFGTLAQIPPPVLTIKPLGTNVYAIAVANGVPATTYGIYWTPVLNDADYPWTVFVGTNGQTNFTLNMYEYSSGFFMGAVSTNGIPPWELADPSDPSLGILSVTIDSPTNGAALQ
ncbi:MAG TPA: hypothetical protein VMF08_20120 [Candidatus Sulfotelmatobacter sp.]|nr:hypothetical protein [Candidatus Sulfotelmatobacter sp.]